MIASSQNPKIQKVRALQAHAHARQEAQAFVVEGVRLVEEALMVGWTAELVLYSEGLGERGLSIVETYSRFGAVVERVSEKAMRAASDTQTPQGLLAVLPMRRLPLPKRLDFAFIPDGVHDPGNLGTMLRTCAAAGVQAVFLPPGSVDPFSPKVVRAGMGAHFRLPVCEMGWGEIGSKLKQTGLRVYLAAAGAGEAYTRADFCTPLALIIGGEAQGAGQEGRQLAEKSVHIPMPGGVESLNAAIAASILIFEVVRQRSANEQSK
jgi:TrmH family RNA methyltransferase